jgi:ferredoxin
MKGISDQCDIVAIRGANGVPGMRMGHLLEYDLIGIGSPTWRSSPTPNILFFINRMPSLENHFWFSHNYEKKYLPEEKQHCFFFMTHGKSPGGAIKRMWDALDHRGLTAIGWDDWYGDAFMAYAQKPWQTHGHPDEIALKEAEEFGRQMVERSRRISQGESELIPKLPEGEEYLKLYGADFDRSSYAKWIHHHYGVKIIEEECTKCGICVENCPMDAIDLDSNPQILPTCIWCTTCELVCPEGAIDINMEALKADRGRTIEEIREKAKDLQVRFEKRQAGLVPEKRLRMLVDPADLWKDGYVTDITDNPRVVIPKEGWPVKEKK